jgi:hypothetical protein
MYNGDTTKTYAFFLGPNERALMGSTPVGGSSVGMIRMRLLVQEFDRFTAIRAMVNSLARVVCWLLNLYNESR